MSSREKPSFIELCLAIPNEIWINIYTFLPVNHLLNSSCLVSKRWNSLSTNRIVYVDQFRSKYSLPSTDLDWITLKDIQVMLTKNDGVNEYKFESYSHTSEVDLEFLTLGFRCELVDWNAKDDVRIYLRDHNADFYVIASGENEGESKRLVKVEIRKYTSMNDEWYFTPDIERSRYGDRLHIYNSAQNSPIQGSFTAIDSQGGRTSFQLTERRSFGFGGRNDEVENPRTQFINFCDRIGLKEEEKRSLEVDDEQFSIHHGMSIEFIQEFMRHLFQVVESFVAIKFRKTFRKSKKGMDGVVLVTENQYKKIQELRKKKIKKGLVEKIEEIIRKR